MSIMVILNLNKLKNLKPKGLFNLMIKIGFNLILKELIYQSNKYYIMYFITEILYMYT